MRIVGPNATARATAPPATKRSAAGGFSVAEDEAPRTSQPVASLRTIGGIDALIALQGQDERQERRRRAVGRGKIAPSMRWTSSRSSFSPARRGLRR